MPRKAVVGSCAALADAARGRQHSMAEQRYAASCSRAVCSVPGAPGRPTQVTATPACAARRLPVGDASSLMRLC